MQLRVFSQMQRGFYFSQLVVVDIPRQIAIAFAHQYLTSVLEEFQLFPNENGHYCAITDDCFSGI